MPEDAVVFSRRTWEALIEDCLHRLPLEACGLLGASGGIVRGVFPADNARHSSASYEIAAADQIRLRKEIADAGYTLWGIYHSHPGGVPWPSQVDITQAYYRDLFYVIVSCGPGKPAVGVFRIVNGQVSARPVRILPEA